MYQSVTVRLSTLRMTFLTSGLQKSATTQLHPIDLEIGVCVEWGDIWFRKMCFHLSVVVHEGFGKIWLHAQKQPMWRGKEVDCIGCHLIRNKFFPLISINRCVMSLQVQLTIRSERSCLHSSHISSCKGDNKNRQWTGKEGFAGKLLLPFSFIWSTDYPEILPKMYIITAVGFIVFRNCGYAEHWKLLFERCLFFSWIFLQWTHCNACKGHNFP